MKRNYHAATSHASYFIRYASMAAAQESIGHKETPFKKLALAELEDLADIMGFDLVKREAAEVDGATA